LDIVSTFETAQIFKIKLVIMRELPKFSGFATIQKMIFLSLMFRSNAMAHRRAFIPGVLAALLSLSSLPAMSAQRFDGAWTLTAVTTKGHCGVIPMTMEVVRGRVHGTGGSYAFIPISLGGRIAGSGSASIKALSGPRVAYGTGRFTHFAGQGTWHGKGPSGLCFGTWTASRS
jgi:hypothetical protein